MDVPGPFGLRRQHEAPGACKRFFSFLNRTGFEAQAGDERHSQLADANSVGDIGTHVKVGVPWFATRLESSHGAIGPVGPGQPDLDPRQSLAIFVLNDYLDVRRLVPATQLFSLNQA